MTEIEVLNHRSNRFEMVNIENRVRRRLCENGFDLQSYGDLFRGDPLDDVRHRRIGAIEFDERDNERRFAGIVFVVFTYDSEIRHFAFIRKFDPALSEIGEAFFACLARRNENLSAFLAFHAEDFFLVAQGNDELAPDAAGEILIGKGELPLYNLTVFVFRCHLAAPFVGLSAVHLFKI
jgi:hypothetical protein